MKRAIPERATGWQTPRRIEGQYGRQLMGIAREVGRLVRSASPDDPQHMQRLETSLRAYAEVITPWAEQTAGRMVAMIERQDARKWERAAQTMSRALRRELDRTDTGAAQRRRMWEQVTLIKSLPLDAAQRVHDLTLEGQMDATRAKDFAAHILETGQVTASRAMLIARTEVARTATELTRARAVQVGCEGYLWRTARDSDVRATHKKLEGKYIRWDSPPECDPGHHAHAGQIWNCRCYPEPVIPDL